MGANVTLHLLNCMFNTIGIPICIFFSFLPTLFFLFSCFLASFLFFFLSFFLSAFPSLPSFLSTSIWFFFIVTRNKSKRKTLARTNSCYYRWDIWEWIPGYIFFFTFYIDLCFHFRR